MQQAMAFPPSATSNDNLEGSEFDMVLKHRSPVTVLEEARFEAPDTARISQKISLLWLVRTDVLPTRLGSDVTRDPRQELIPLFRESWERHLREREVSLGPTQPPGAPLNRRGRRRLDVRCRNLVREGNVGPRAVQIHPT